MTEGNRITIDALLDTLPEDIRLFLLGSALGAIQIQRGRLPIHGGAVVVNGRAVIVTGNQGAGKSTMTSALVGEGLPYLTDDVSSIAFDPAPVVHPAYPQRKLVRDACVRLGFDPDKLPVVDSDRDKFAIRDRERWQGIAAPLGALIELSPLPKDEEMRIEPVLGHASLRLIMKHLYRPWMHLKDGQIPPDDFQKLLTAAGVLKMYKAYVPRNIDNISIYAARLAKEMSD
jgi:hypothetical protein